MEHLLVSSRLHFNSLLFILIGNVYLQGLEFSVQAALWIFLFVRCRFDYSYRKRTDFVGKRSLPLRQGRQGGAAPLTPATFEKVD